MTNRISNFDEFVNESFFNTRNKLHMELYTNLADVVDKFYTKDKKTSREEVVAGLKFVADEVERGEFEK